MSITAGTDQDILLAQYTLGVLSPQETAQAHQLLGSDSQAVVTALDWENAFLELTDLLPPVDPSPLLLQRIQTALGHDTTPALFKLYRQPASDATPEPADTSKPRAQPPAPKSAARLEPTMSPISATAPVTTPAAISDTSEPAAQKSEAAQAPTHEEQAPKLSPSPVAPPTAPPGQPRPRRSSTGNIWIWRAGTLLFAVIALFLGLMPAKPLAPPVTVVEVAPTQAAILQAPGQSSTPGWVVTLDAQRNVLMKPQVRSDIPADAAVQLWTHSKAMPQPRSLGLIDPNQPVTVPATLIGDINPGQIFEMTLEPAGGSPTAGPSGPVLFIGRIVVFGEPAAPSPVNASSAEAGPT